MEWRRCEWWQRVLLGDKRDKVHWNFNHDSGNGVNKCIGIATAGAFASNLYRTLPNVISITMSNCTVLPYIMYRRKRTEFGNKRAKRFENPKLKIIEDLSQLRTGNILSRFGIIRSKGLKPVWSSPWEMVWKQVQHGLRLQDADISVREDTVFGEAASSNTGAQVRAKVN